MIILKMILNIRTIYMNTGARYRRHSTQVHESTQTFSSGKCLCYGGDTSRRKNFFLFYFYFLSIQSLIQKLM